MLQSSGVVEMIGMETLLEELNPSKDALRRWKSAITTMGCRRRRFRLVVDLVRQTHATKITQTHIPIPAPVVEEEVRDEAEEESAGQMADSTLNPIETDIPIPAPVLEEEERDEAEEEFAGQMAYSTLNVLEIEPAEEEIDVESDEAIPEQMWVRPVRSIYKVLIKAKLNIFLPYGPLAVLLHYLSGPHEWVLFFCLLGMSPLEERLGYATQQFALHQGPTVGFLLNATFGSTTEMIISIFALKNGMIRVVQLSLLGSILANMLLWLGCAFLTSEIIHRQELQIFNEEAALGNLGLLLVAVIGMFFPSVLKITHTEEHFGTSELSLSRFTSFMLLVAYASCLLFQLKGGNLHDPITESLQVRDGSAEDSDEEVATEIGQWEAVGWLSILTIWQSVLAEYLTNSIQGASDSWNVSAAFISVIVIPAAVRANAIVFAMQEKLDISLRLAIGLSTQISMFVIPLCVVVGWFMRMPMDLNFQLFETASLFITVLVVAFLLKEKSTNCFKGLLLILCYLIVAASFFVHIDPSNGHK